MARKNWWKFWFPRIPYLVLIGIPNDQEMNSVVEYLDKNGIPHSKFIDTDFDFGLAAVATSPLTEDQRKFLRFFPLWKEQPKD